MTLHIIGNLQKRGNMSGTQQFILALGGMLVGLLGAAIGVFGAWKMHQATLAHTDKTRFHEKRLEVYAAANSAASSLMAAFTATSMTLDQRTTWLRSFDLMLLVGSPGVKDAYKTVHDLVTEAMAGGIADKEAHTNKYGCAMANLAMVMRAELGTDKALGAGG